MRPHTAKLLHQATNITYWWGNPEWHTGISAADATLDATRLVWQTTNHQLLHRFFDMQKVITVSGETVVAEAPDNTVDKFMFRRPRKLSLVDYETAAKREIGLVCARLAGIALPTQVSIKPAYIFRDPQDYVLAVTQTQERLNLSVHGALDLPRIADEPASAKKDQTARDLEILLAGADKLVTSDEFYPDVTRSGGNVRRSGIDGSVVLLDVSPFYPNGRRLIGDRPPGTIAAIQRNLDAMQEFVCSYGA